MGQMIVLRLTLCRSDDGSRMVKHTGWATSNTLVGDTHDAVALALTRLGELSERVLKHPDRFGVSLDGTNEASLVLIAEGDRLSEAWYVTHGGERLLSAAEGVVRQLFRLICVHTKPVIAEGAGYVH